MVYWSQIIKIEAWSIGISLAIAILGVAFIAIYISYKEKKWDSWERAMRKRDKK